MTALTSDQSTGPRISGSRKLSLLGIWFFPYLLAGGAWLAGAVYEGAAALRSPVLAWPIPQEVYGWLLLMVILAIAWVVAELFSVTNRETVVLALQWDTVVSTFTALTFSLAGGWFVGTGTLEWWFVVPWIASVIDAFAAGWLGVNNAAQKPFLSQRGIM
jgi:hypothetical protein